MYSRSAGIHTRQNGFAATLLGAMILAALPAFAHHSAAMFDSTRVVELTGTVKELQWTNPHIWIQVNVQNAAGVMEEWSIEGGSPATLSRNGWRPTSFKPSDQVTLKIHPMRDGSHAGNFIGAKFSDGRTIGRWDEGGGE